MRLSVIGLGVMCVVLFTTSCLTYYEREVDFNSRFVQGDLMGAQSLLASKAKYAHKKNRLLYWLNLGLVESMLGHYAKSNEYLEQAYIFTEDYQKSVGLTALSLLTNPNVMPYAGEPQEWMLINYYKAYNCVMLGDMNSALIEVRRLNLRLQQLTDLPGQNRKYKRDAAMYTLMGLVYDAAGDYNNAYISYRNAYETINEDLKELYGAVVPEQLKKDLLRSAARMGFWNELAFYEKEMGMKYVKDDNAKTEIVALWHNGLGPVKAAWSINFTIITQGNTVTFFNNDLGLSFTFPMDSDQSTSLSTLQFLRVEFPRYYERPEYWVNGSVRNENGEVYPLQPVENLSRVSVQALRDRMEREFAAGLLRLAIKTAAAEAVKKENEGLGSALNIVNALTERADTRNWQIMPHTIYYTRVKANEGTNALIFSATDRTGHAMQIPLTIQATKNRTSFVMVTTPNHLPLVIPE